MYGQGGHKLEMNIPQQQIFANSKGELIIEGGVISSQYGNYRHIYANSYSMPVLYCTKLCVCVFVICAQ